MSCRWPGFNGPRRCVVTARFDRVINLALDDDTNPNTVLEGQGLKLNFDNQFVICYNREVRIVTLLAELKCVN